MIDIDIPQLKEKTFDDKVVASTQQLMERLTLDEQMRVSFVPPVIIRLAWIYAYKAMEMAASERVSDLKKLCRVMKQLHTRYVDDLKKDLDYRHIEIIDREADCCIEELSRDLMILYFSVNQEFKRKYPHYNYDELRTNALISSLFIDMLARYNKRIDKLLAEKLDNDKLVPSLIHPLIQKLKIGVDCMAGVNEKFNREEINITLAMKVIENRIDKIEFTTY